MKIIRPIFCSLWIMSIFGVQASSQGLFLNEFMASNTRTFADRSGDFEDWIEIYNPAATPVNLSGYYLTDDLNNLKKHRLTPLGNEMVVPAKGYLVVWASSNTGKGSLHVGFGLSAGGEALALVAPDGITVLDSHVFGVQKQDISRGRTENGGGAWVYYDKPTPGASNQTSQGYEGFLNPPSFSMPGGFYPESFAINLFTNEPGARIIYTLDGSEPDAANINGKAYNYKNSYPGKVGDGFGPMLSDTLRSYVYREDLRITDRTKSAPVLANKSSTVDAQPYIPPADFFKGTSVRARVVKEGYLSSDIITQTYFVTAKGWNRYSLPVAALTIPANRLFGYEEGIYNAGKAFDDWRRKNPLGSNMITADINFNRRGDASERIANFEYFSENSNKINQQIGIRVHGGSSRLSLIKTIRLYARSELGKSTFENMFFPGYPYESFKRLLLKPDDWKWTTIRDFAVQHLAKGLKFDIQEGQPSVFFINGEYWGLHIVRERQDRHLFERKYGIREGELDLLENANVIVQEGDNKDYLALRDFIRTKNLNVPANFDYVKSKMDIENYTDYFINGIFVTNRDWPGNNIRYFRKNTPSPPGTAGELDGRWRWILHDLDESYTNIQVNQNYLERIIPNDYVFLKNFLVIPSYRDYFINRYADLLNSVYVSSWCTAKIDSIASLVKPYLPEHRYRLMNDSSARYSLNGIIDMKNFANRRPDIVRKHLRDYFNLADTHRIKVNVLKPEMGYVSVNTLDLREGTPGIANQPYPWQGIYFGGIPVTLIAKAKPGYRFVKWQGDTSLIIDTLILHLTGPFRAEAIFEPAPVFSEAQLIHYWHFNNLPSGTLQSIVPDSTLVGGASISYPGTGNGYLDRVTGEGSAINTQYNQAAGTALRVRNPSNSRELKLKIPSTNFGDIGFGWATIRTGSGAQEQKVYYSTDEGNASWTEISGIITVTENYQFSVFSLKGISAADNNPNLAIKIVFSGSNASGSSGNNRFDNITVTGKVVRDNCNGSQPQLWFRDADNDGFSDGTRLLQCAKPEGYRLLSSLTGTVLDCNDLNALEKPAATWYKDADNDGYSEGSILVQCTRPQGYKRESELKSVNGDCNDSDAGLNPETVWYQDADNDGFSNGTTVAQCLQPAGYKPAKALTALSMDCNDADSTLNPETSWFRDMDGDGYTDSTVLKQCLRPNGYKRINELISNALDCRDDNREISPATVWYKDSDGDGFSNGATLAQCLRLTGYKLPTELVSISGDCNDSDAILNPETVWYQDADNDGFSNGTTVKQCLQPAGYKLAQSLTALSMDCNDADSTINPDTKWYKDMDGDGYTDSTILKQCLRPDGYKLLNELVSNALDCRDDNREISPATVWYKDSDGDGFSNGVTLAQCPRPTGYKLPAELVSISGDCNDSDAILNPETVWYQDADNDGFSNGTTVKQCLQPAGFKLSSGLTNLTADCNDAVATINPLTTWYKDADGDGHSDGVTKVQCEKPVGFALPTDLVKTSGDCNDNDATVFPGGIEFPDGQDNDCNGETDEGPPLDIRVAPNPVTNELRLILQIFVPGQKVEVSLVNTDGRVYVLGSLQPVQFGQITQYEVRNMAAGTYILRVRQGANQLTKKVLIIR